MAEENRDMLTGLHTTKYLETRLKEEIMRTLRYKRPLTLLLFQINYSYFMSDVDLRGVQAYSILRQFSAILLKNLRAIDVACRFNGELFAVILPETSAEGGMIVAERIRKEATGYSFTGDANIPHVRVALDGGLATCPHHGKTLEEFVTSAREALQRAKTWGGNIIFTCQNQLYTEEGEPVPRVTGQPERYQRPSGSRVHIESVLLKREMARRLGHAEEGAILGVPEPESQEDEWFAPETKPLSSRLLRAEDDESETESENRDVDEHSGPEVKSRTSEEREPEPQGAKPETLQATLASNVNKRKVLGATISRDEFVKKLQQNIQEKKNVNEPEN